MRLYIIFLNVLFYQNFTIALNFFNKNLMHMRKILLGMAMLFFAYAASSQSQAVTGKVTDQKGTAVPQATIIEKGTRNGTFAADDGSFSIKVKPGATLVVSAVGYVTIDVPSSKAASITLPLDTRSLSEVVVTGVGSATSKRHLGITVVSVSADKLPAAPTASIDQALIGKIPGAQISSISGNPGDPVNILLRGINTVQGGTRPLIILDGVEVRSTDLNSLDLSDIERVEVVQGAASASLYGAQGANGVIQLFSKKGKKGSAKVSGFTSYASNSYINNGNVHKAALHPYLTDASNNIVDVNGNILQIDSTIGSLSGISYQFGGPARYAILDPRNIADKPYNANLKYYDQFAQVFQNGSTTNNGINISGATDKSDYSISVSNNHTISPVMQNGYLDRTNLTVNLGTELFKGFKIRSITQLVYTRNTLVPGLGAPGGVGYGEGNQAGNVGAIYGFMNTSPFFSLKQKLSGGGLPIYQLADFLSVNSNNPYYVQEYSEGLDNKIDVVQSFDANYKVDKFVELDAKYGIDYKTEGSRWTYLNQSNNANSVYYNDWQGYENGNNNLGEIDQFQYGATFQNFNANALFKTDFQKDFHSKLPIQTATLVGFDYRKRKYTEYDTYGLGLPVAPPINVQSTSSQYVAFDFVDPFVTYGYYVNQKIDIGDWGGVAGGFRSDWASTFGGGSRPFTFPSLNAYILPSSFNFWENSKLGEVVPLFKLRSAFGEAGIQPGDFQRIPTLNQGNLGSQLAYSFQSSSQNPALNVEVSKEFEAGTDFTVSLNKTGSWFKQLNITFNYWKRNTDNAIYPVSVPPSTGTTQLATNAMFLKSDGEEFSVNLPVVASRNFNWDFTTNFGHQSTVVTKILGGSDIITSSNVAGNTALVLTPGAKIGQIYGYKAITSLTETQQDGKTPYINPSDYSNYTMVDGRVVNIATRAIQFTNQTYPIGDPNPKFNASFINGFSYKGMLTLSFQFDWIYGSHLYNQTKEWMYRDGLSGDFEKKVNIGGTNAAYTAYWASAYYQLGADATSTAHGPGNDATKDFFWENSSFVRLRNISLAFDITKVAKIKYLSKLQLILSGRNILTFTKYTGSDPEVSSGVTNSSYDRGVDGNTIPNIKSYQVGLNVAF